MRDLLSAIALATLIAGGLGLVAASARPDAPPWLFAASDNLLLASAIAAFALAWFVPSAEEPGSSPARGGAILGLMLPLLAGAAVFARDRSAGLGQVAAAVVIGGATVLVVRAVGDPGEAPSTDTGLGVARSRWLPAIFAAACLVASLGAPASSFAFLIAATGVLVGPGLALGALLLPEETRLRDRFLWSPALGLGAGVLVLLWLDFLGIRASRAVFLSLMVALCLLPLAPFAGRRAR